MTINQRWAVSAVILICSLFLLVLAGAVMARGSGPLPSTTPSVTPFPDPSRGGVGTYTY